MADVVFETSGSTGVAKRIVRTEASLLDDARRLVSAFPEIWGTDPKDRGPVPHQKGDSPLLEWGQSLGNGDRPLVVASVHPEHMYGALWRVRVPKIVGYSVADETVVSVEELVALHEKHGALVFVTTPSFLEKAIAHPDFSKLKGAFRAIVTSGSRLRDKTALEVAEAIGVCPLEIYGSTEAGTVAWRRRVAGEAWTLVEGVTGSVDDAGLLVVDSPYAVARPWMMADRVEMLSPRQFRLLGRADRQVKVLETFVSLGVVEETLAAHPFVDRVRVEPFGDGVTRLGALIVPSAAGRTALGQDGQPSVVAALRTALRKRLDAVAVPRRIRFVRELPVNEQGKTTAAAVRQALGVWCREPTVTAWRATADRLEAELVFRSDLECFKGHFPGFPILPGVAQLYFLRHFARQAFADWPDAATWRRLKFQKVILPDRPVKMTVEHLGAGWFSFEIAGVGGRCTSGTVERSAT